MKSKEELEVIKKELEALNGKLAHLSEDELEQVTAGVNYKNAFIPIILLKSNKDLPNVGNFDNITIDTGDSEN